MATAQSNKKVYVSPGVYTSETDLSFVAQSVGVTTLGLVGESLKGPAFEPVFVTNFDEFQAFFGGTDPTKFINTQIPKYEAAYIAKSYLQQSNQMFFTRILGLSGYDAGPSWSIKVVANVDPTTIVITASSGESFSQTFQGNNTGNTFSFNGLLPDIIEEKLNIQYRTNNGDVSTLFEDFQKDITDISLTTTNPLNIFFYGAIPTLQYDIETSLYTDITNALSVDSPSLDFNDMTSPDNDAWYYANFTPQGDGTYTGYSFYYYVNTITTGATGDFSGEIVGSVYTFSGECFTNYDNMVVATLRSRGITLYGGDYHGPSYMVTGLSNVDIVTDGIYSASTQSPYEAFLISGTTFEGNPFSFEVSVSSLSPRFITKVLGTDNFSKSRYEVPLFVEEAYANSLMYAYNQGFIRGINSELVALPEARSLSARSIAYNLEKYQSSKTPYFASELRGNKVYKLFRFVTISDGDDSSEEIKISIANISFNNMTFDVLVRNFADEDSNPVVIERFTNLSMNPSLPNYIAKRIGTTNGEYSLLSKYVMVEMSDEAPIDALPCGFFGYEQRIYDTADPLANPSPIPAYKTRYFFPGEVIANPPFGTPFGSNAIESSGDIVRRSYLGFSTSEFFGLDSSLLSYKGKKNPGNWIISPTMIEGAPWNYMSQGFHMDINASIIPIGSEYVTSGKPAFEVGAATFTEDPQTQESPYYFTYSRKFTACFAGGFDGWDIYREFRTNEDRFQLGASGFLAGSAPSVRYPTATGGDSGVFKRIVVENNASDFANTDYYAYLLGILTFNNPESTNINVFATTSIDYHNNQKLVEETIDMIQFQRADSVYIATTPDYEMYTPIAGDPEQIVYPQEAIDRLDDTGIDSNYTSTYYPWILVRDTVNNTQLYIPPTGEVCRNLALTDNIAFPWFASAGYTRGLVNSVKARLKLTQEDRDTLYQGRINPIATFADVGTVIWGNKTLQVADSALNRLNVRRLLLQARKLISAVAVRLLFEQNDQIVRQQFLDSVNPILDAIRRDRGLYDFRVTVSSSPEDLDRNTLYGKIYLKPTKALEFIDIEFFITPTGASFENI
jgi:hypothetical protein